MNKAFAIGIDVGSTTWKAVAIDESGQVLATILEPTNPLIEVQTNECLAKLKEKCGADDGILIGATGYGRKKVHASKILTEITCHAKGAFYHTKKPSVLIDIGGQDTKVIHLGTKGEVLDFAMNDKCAAGTGRFLEVILGRLNVELDDIARRVSNAKKSIMISSTCTVFAESEVVSLLAGGEDVDEIVKGLHISLASRVSALAGNIAKDAEIFMSGGVALNAAMVNALSESTGKAIQVLPNPQLIGALGAALAVLR